MNSTRNFPLRLISAFSGALLLIAVLFLVPAKVRPTFANHPPTLPPVILISIDTLRADHLSCYGYHPMLTPHLDALAQGGTRFARIDSQVPLTLPSHTSLFTSTYPFANGVEENGEVVPKSLVTLATVMKAHGYRTAAFIGGYFLARRFGLDRGFDVYDSPFDFTGTGPQSAAQLKRSAENVTAAASRWINVNSSGPFFAFVHLFDLHKPYDLETPSPSTAGVAGYDAELAHVDGVLGDFFRQLAKQGIYQRSLIVVLSDHGESLGEHGESTHGYFIYQSTLWVPLIVHWPAGGHHFPAEVQQPAGLIDVAPTLLEFLHIAPPPEFQGRSLFRFFEASHSQTQEEVYSESLYAYDHFDCAPLRTLRLGRYQYIAAPKPELYDLLKDPQELTNLYAERRSLSLSMAARLRSRMAKFSPAQRPRVAVSPGTVEELNSLGYLGASRPAARLSETGPDPKDRLGEYRQSLRALRLEQTGRLAEAITEYQEILAEIPGLALARFNLASCYFQAGRFPDAIKELKKNLAADPHDLNTENLLGLAWMRMGNPGEARSSFQNILTQDPSNYLANYDLGMLDEVERNWQTAEDHFSNALRVQPQSPAIFNALGILFMDRGQAGKAQHDFQTAIRLDPTFAQAFYNLGTLWAAENHYREAAQAFRRALAADPKFADARRALDALPLHKL
ncbi:MAG TPA: sulfatase-like hydrolase/transferase [Terriglobia bacterium]|nr:sulfatase-like hydrolase/transferase [Terriglobia bacterium]